MTNVMGKFFSMYLFLFITLYMFRAHCAHHQERQIVPIQPLVTVILCWCPRCVQVGRSIIIIIMLSSSLVTGLFFLVLLLNQRWSPPLWFQASHCRTFRIMCDAPSIAVFCSESIECFPGTASKFFLKLLVIIPVAPITIGIIVHFRFHIRCISIHKLLYYYYYYYYLRIPHHNKLSFTLQWGFFLRGLYFHFSEPPDCAKGHLGNTTLPIKTLGRTYKTLLPTGNRTAALRHYSPQLRDCTNYATLPPQDRNLSLKSKTNLNCVWGFSSYRTVNTPRQCSPYPSGYTVYAIAALFYD